MNQTLHIFSKDIRRLRVPLAMVELLICAHAVLAVRAVPVSLPDTERLSGIASLTGILLPITIALLIALLVFDECLVGDDQFWRTRPYKWGELLGAKILLCVLFLNLPLLLSDCFILGAQGFPVQSALGDIFLRQVPLTALFMLPSFAFATLTTGVAQFLLAWFIVFLAIIMQTLTISMRVHSSSIHSGVGVAFGESSIAIGFLIAVTCAMVIWQYAKRRTGIARILGLTLAFTVWPVLSGISFLVSAATSQAPIERSENRSGIAVTYDLDKSPPSGFPYERPPENYVLIRLPLIVKGLPPNTILRGNGMVSIFSGGSPWPDRNYQFVSSVDETREGYSQRILLEKSRVASLGSKPITLQSRFDLEAVNNKASLTISETATEFFVSDVIHCRAYREAVETTYACRAGLGHTVETALRTHSPAKSDLVRMILPVLSLPMGLSPVMELGSTNIPTDQPSRELEIVPREQRSAFRETLQVTVAQLSGFMLPPR